MKFLPAAVLLGYALVSDAGTEPQLAVPYATPSVYNFPKIVPQPAGVMRRKFPLGST